MGQYGVSSEPEFSTTELKRGDRVVFASDGLWDVAENAEVALLCSYRNTSSKCAQALLRIAKEKYQKSRMRNGRADNTCICVGYMISEESAPSEEPTASSQ